MPSLFYIGYDVKREERYFPPFELVRRLARPHNRGRRQMIRGKASIICTVTTENKEGRQCLLYFLSKTLRQGTMVLAVA